MSGGDTAETLRALSSEEKREEGRTAGGSALRGQGKDPPLQSRTGFSRWICLRFAAGAVDCWGMGLRGRSLRGPCLFVLLRFS